MTVSEFMNEAIRLSYQAMEEGNGPFGAVVVKNGQIIGRGKNQVVSKNDPTAHAEIMAIREACLNLGSFHLDDCEIYSSCEPCPMCLGAIYWAKPRHIYYCNKRSDAAAIGFEDEFIYQELEVDPEVRQIPASRFFLPDAIRAFERWDQIPEKVKY
jgi:guanine deaminase